MNLKIDNTEENKEIQQVQEQSPQLTEHEQAMINKAKENRGEQIEQKEPELKEELIAGKFKTQEELLKAYKELESKIGVKSKEPETKEIETKKEQKEPEQKEVSTVNDFNKYFEEFSKNNTISEESYKELETKHKIPKEIVDAYVQGQKVLYEKAQQETEIEILETVGGKENYNEVVNWAKANLTVEEINEYNELLLLGDLKTSKLAVQNLFYRYKTNNINTPQVKTNKIITGNTTIVNTNSFKDQKEFYSAMNDKRYKNDKNYREEVMIKRKNSNF